MKHVCNTYYSGSSSSSRCFFFLSLFFSLFRKKSTIRNGNGLFLQRVGGQEGATASCGCSWSIGITLRRHATIEGGSDTGHFLSNRFCQISFQSRNNNTRNNLTKSHTCCVWYEERQHGMERYNSRLYSSSRRTHWRCCFKWMAADVAQTLRASLV